MNSNAASYPVRSRQAIPDLINLENDYTHSLDKNLMEADGSNLGSIAKGVRAYQNSVFDIRGLLFLDQMGQKGPSSVSIKVGLKGRRLHLLQGTVGSVPTDTSVAVYTLNYADGRTRTVNMIYNRNVRDLLDTNQLPLTDAKLVLLDKNTQGVCAQLARYTINNPLPDIEVENIEITSSCPESRPILVGMTLERLDPVYEWFDEIKVGTYNPILPRSIEATPDMIDLTDYYGASLDDDWFNHSSHDLHDVPKGVQCLGETFFDVRGLICLAGSHSLEITGLALLEKVEGIPVDRRGVGIHFLHACAFSAPRGTKIGEYVLNYEDGSHASADIIYGVNVIDWWSAAIVSDAQIAWIGSHAAARLMGKQTRLIKFVWSNPKPELKIITLDYISSLADPAPFLVAATVIAE